MTLHQSTASSPPKGLLWLLLALIALLSLLPSLRLLISALFDWQQGSNSSLWRVLSNESTWVALYNSLYTSGLGTVLSLLLGSFFAFCLALTNIRGKQIWVFLFMLPMMIPPQVTALSWLQLFGPSSILLNSIGLAPGFGSTNPLYSPEGIALLLGIQHAPLVFLALRTQLQCLPKEQIEAARLNGASLWRVFIDIVLPLCRTALWAGAAIAFVSALGNFGIPAMLGIPISYFVLPIQIYQTLSSFGPSMLNDVAALSVLMGVLAIGIVTLQGYMQRRHALPLIGMAGRALSFQLGKWRLATEVLLGMVLCAILLAPLLALIATSLVPTLGVPLNADTLTFAAWRAMFDNQSATWRALTNSISLSVSASLVLMLLCLPLAWLLVRYPSRPLRWLYSVIDIPYTLPGVVLAIAFILLFARPLPLVGISLSGTLTIIFLAYLARFLTVCLKPVHNSMLQLDPAMEEAASLAGANFSQRLRHIVLPLLAPAAFAGALLVFLTAVNELTVSALLWSAGKETLGVVIFNLDESGNKVLASAISVLVVGLVACVMLLLSSLGKYLPKGVIPWQS
ncbi:iron ABC transporter permease [Phytobacter diazotrophicus]|uniref:ABC transporter permease n=1 Tax=Phytobacter diazotrophicus TaxID=395631 RepID=UPI000893F946|nr:iron ABC transporter permease [Phytobacter diazotrophicus]AUU88667.1 iron ABC transporter permease [Enterobacteriaceae bacterium ENNIH3]AUV06042.1 iron ABC transporter permease [Enterobacteriaceae bacterium ENNIH2]PWF52697.1 iron ABC transporter permease [[Kluyvera] intestini]MBY6258867.1 iron ABC transporter permease [Phytobacter diazotrophicus]MDV2904171.1 iron ABC transporter permease [Phytobacter diazotrophicus]